MYKYGIAYYEMSGTSRVPVSGLTVKLLRPGDDWAAGLLMSETVEHSGYYEIDIVEEADCGYYEIWDNQNNPSGAFCGKTCIVGTLDARGLQNGSIYADHMVSGCVTEGKYANNSIGETRLKSTFKLPWAKVDHELQTEANGTGDVSSEKPPNSSDGVVYHTFEGEYSAVPSIIITPRAGLTPYLLAAEITDSVLSVSVGLYNPETKDPLYDILVIK